MNKVRGADIVAQSLESLGVTRVFTLSGNHIMPIFDALLGTKIEVFHVRHEAACVHMADAWGRLTGEVGVAIVTGGQGFTNGAAALFTAMSAESPMLLLSGHAGLREAGRGAFQELAQADLARPVSKASWTAASISTIGDDIARGISIAQAGRPGPVHIALPVDLLEGEVPVETVILPEIVHLSPVEPSHRLIDHAAQIVANHKRPIIILGPALSGADRLAQARVVEELSGVPVVAMQSPRGTNDPSLGSFAEAVADADLIVLVGKALDFTLRFGDVPTLSSQCNFIVFDADPELIARVSRDKGARLLAAGTADPAMVLVKLGFALSATASERLQWRDRVRADTSYEPPEWASAQGRDGQVHPVQLCRAIGDFLKQHPGGTLVCDGGEIGQWPQAVIHDERMLLNGVSGTIGVSIPFAIAAQVVTPDAPVVAVLGDGTFGFHMAEFDTAVRYNLPIIVVIGNDARWNAEYQIQVRNYGADRAKNCDLLPSRYEQVAIALGGYGILVTSADELPAALEAARASGKPACINVMIESVPAPTVRRSKAA